MYKVVAPLQLPLLGANPRTSWCQPILCLISPALSLPTHPPPPPLRVTPDLIAPPPQDAVREKGVPASPQARRLAIPHTVGAPETCCLFDEFGSLSGSPCSPQGSSKSTSPGLQEPHLAPAMGVGTQGTLPLSPVRPVYPHVSPFPFRSANPGLTAIKGGRELYHLRFRDRGTEEQRGSVTLPRLHS